MVELRSLGAQLDSVAEMTDASTRERCHAEHEGLTERVVVLEQRASDYQSAVASHADDWLKFNQQLDDVWAGLDDVENTLPTASVDVTSDVSVLRQQVKACRDVADRLQTEMLARVDGIKEQGGQILEYVDSPRLESQLNSVTDRLSSLTNQSNTDMQRYSMLCILLSISIAFCSLIVKN